MNITQDVKPGDFEILSRSPPPNHRNQLIKLGIVQTPHSHPTPPTHNGAGIEPIQRTLNRTGHSRQSCTGLPPRMNYNQRPAWVPQFPLPCNTNKAPPKGGHPPCATIHPTKTPTTTRFSFMSCASLLVPPITDRYIFFLFMGFFSSPFFLYFSTKELQHG